MSGLEDKIRRIKAGLTQYQAGRIIDVPSYEISKLETGRESAVRGEKLEQYRKALESATAHAGHGGAA